MKHTPLSRKKFLSNAFKTGVILSLSSVSKSIFAFSASDSESYRKNPIAYAEAIGLTSKIQKILLTAMLAPNSHNTQPWKVKIDSENSFLLYGDADRTLKAIDPIYRQFFHSQGTFLELAKLTADSLMYNSKITFFPKGIPSSAEKFITYPVARFEIQEKSECVHYFLFLSLPNRVMNRSEYSGEFLKEDDINNLNKLTFAKFVNLKFILGEEKIKEFHSPLIASFEAEVNLREANELSRIWFRSANEEIYTKRDGITLEGNGLSGVKLWIAKKFFLDLTETGWHSESSKKASVAFASSSRVGAGRRSTSVSRNAENSVSNRRIRSGSNG